MDSRVSVVIATRNRAAELLTTLDRLRALPERPRVVVVDNASTDGTSGQVRARFADVELIELDENIGPAARTVGVRAVDAPFVAFCDDDSWWAPGALSLAAHVLERHARVGLVAARVLVGPDEREDPTCAEMARSPLSGDASLPGPRVLGFVACGAVVRRAAYLAVGGFNRRFDVGGEERLLAVDLERGGWRLVYVPSIVAHHHPSPARDEQGRREAEVRNELWFSWLRRPRGPAVARTASLLRGGVRESAVWAGALGAVRGLPWVLRERRAVDARLERELRAVTRQPS